jgi:hypothetical protein
MKPLLSYRACQINKNLYTSNLQHATWKVLTDKHQELSELIDLFSIDALEERKSQLVLKKKSIDDKYLPQIKEAKRVLSNTNKRLEYHNNKRVN